ncbi:MAG: S8 family serine peptidase [Acidobacteriota bacterium]
MTRFRHEVLGTSLAIALLASPAFAERYLVVFEEESLKTGEAAAMMRQHDVKMVRDLSDIGLALIDIEDPDQLSKVGLDRKIRGIKRDTLRATAWTGDPIPADAPYAKGDNVSFAEIATAHHFAGDNGITPSTVTAEQLTQTFFWPQQWDLQTMQMDRVWNELGNLGDPDVDIAVVASGIDYTHVELQGRVDLERSRNFVPEDAAMVQDLYPGAHPIADLGLHGTYTASLMTCNALIYSCPVPHATLIGVKWLNFEERGRIGDLVTAVRYAASIGSDIIVIPDQFERRLRWSDRDDRLDILALRRAMFYARLRGSIVLTGAWAERDMCGFDADADGDELLIPAQTGTTVVAATGLSDQWSAESSYGYSLVDIAAPGGERDPVTCQTDPDLYIFSIGACSGFTKFVSPRPFDFSELCNPETTPVWIFSFGVRPAAAHVGSVAAMVEAPWNGWLPGWLVKLQVFRTADDVIDPGFDPFSGWGRVNAYRALTE